MAITIRSAQTIGGGVRLVGNTATITTPNIYLPSTLFELDASTYVGSGDWIDSTGNGRNGQFVGVSTWFNEAGGCFIFNGDPSKRIDVANSNVLSGVPANASFSVWASIPGDSYLSHIAGWRGGVNFWFLMLDYRPTTEARFDNGPVYDIGMDYSPYYGTWAQTTFVVNAAESYTKLYINGVEVGSTAGATGNFSSADNLFTLGCDTNNGFAMTGKIGGATAYTAALTAEEVVAEFNRTKTRYGL